MKTFAILLAILLVLVAAGCAAGPHQLQRSVDDWDHELYVENPLLDGVLWFIPVFPILQTLAFVGDFLITDAYHFWIKDLWDGKGTGFQHYEVKPTDGRLQSLLIDDAKFLQMKQ